MGRPRKYPEIKTGDNIGDMSIDEYVGRHSGSGNKLFKVKCNICGKVRTVNESDINKGKCITHITSCKERASYKKLNIGDIIGDMTVLSYASRTFSGNMRYHVKCNICGKEKIMQSSNINNMVGVDHGLSCIRKDFKGLTHEHPRLYSIWKGIQYRINNPKSPEYHRYGGRGIKNEFKDFSEFVNLMGDSYYEHVRNHGEYNTTIDRVDNDGNYSQHNCTWSTKQVQSLNRSTTVLFKATSPTGNTIISKNIKEFAETHNLSRSSISLCLHGKIKQHKGWKFEFINNIE